MSKPDSNVHGIMEVTNEPGVVLRRKHLRNHWRECYFGLTKYPAEVLEVSQGVQA